MASEDDRHTGKEKGEREEEGGRGRKREDGGREREDGGREIYGRGRGIHAHILDKLWQSVTLARRLVMVYSLCENMVLLYMYML